MDEQMTDPTGPLNSNPSKQPPIPPLVEGLPRAYAPHPDFRSEPSTPEEETFRHSGWQSRRRLVWSAFQRIHLPATRLDRFAECGAGVWLGTDATTGELCMTCNRCHDRWCIPCGTERARVISDQLAIAMDGKECRFVTLTRRANHTPLRDQLDSLFACFNRLRERSFWKSCVHGGAYFTEVKIGERSGLWHVHLHLIVVGHFIDQRALSSEWLAVTQDSSIVDVRAVPQVDHVARYVTKYVTKPADASVFASPDRLDEMIIALRGRRLCGCFGSWSKLKLNGDEEPPRQIVQRRHLLTLLSEVRRGDPEAYAIWRSALLRWPSLAVFQRGASP